jgi:hypothetical protein
VHHLTLRTNLRHEVTLDVSMTCPGLAALGDWQSDPETSPPQHDRRASRLTWTVELPEGESARSWTWG